MKYLLNKKELKMREPVRNAKRIVIKIGTSSLTHENGRLNLEKIEKLVRILTDLNNSGKEMVLVSSGAVNAGMQRLGRNKPPAELAQKQAFAGIGQAILIQIYQKFFNEYNQTIGQILLTRDVMDDQIKRQNARNTFETLLELGVIPIINENDSVSTAEMIHYCFGDNDTLSAKVAQLIEADLLILLSDIEGLYNKNPKEHPDAILISEVESLTDEIRQYAGGAGSKQGTGGMVTKLIAAEIASDSKTQMIIASSENVDLLRQIINGEDIGTWFKASLT